ncbi:MAG: hypothetical protein LBQ50_10215 [Planctomycetaceae bacterium]|jgi:hypothetical protein|nr:hypothetical protein [Planctomycetaceae bacterium]
MTSPILPAVPDEGTFESPALSPSMKIFAATTIIVGGAAIAAAFWKATLDFGAVDSETTVDRSITAAPLPNYSLPEPLAVSGQPATTNNFDNSHQNAVPPVPLAVLPALSQTPSIDSGTGKYAQKYPPPILETATPEKEFMTERMIKTENTKKTGNEKTAIPGNTRFEPIHKISVPASPTKEGNFGKAEKKPPVVPKTGTNDEMLSLFQFADNFEQSLRSKTESPQLNPSLPDPLQSDSSLTEPSPLKPLLTESSLSKPFIPKSGLPENPFLTVSTSTETEHETSSTGHLVPLSVFPESNEPLLPLKSPIVELQPLKVLSTQEPKI